MFHFGVDPSLDTWRERISEDGPVPQRSRSDLGTALDPPYDPPRCELVGSEYSRVTALKPLDADRRRCLVYLGQVNLPPEKRMPHVPVTARMRLLLMVDVECRA